MRKALILVCGFVILALLNYTIYTRETLVRDGESVFLKLAPVDPRSLMQGDYMALRFDVAAAIDTAVDESQAKNGYVILRKDELGVGQFSHLDNGEALAANELRMLYRQRHQQIKFATNAFFFQEGKAELYEDAKYGEFKVAENGDSILVGMRDVELKPLGEVTATLE